MKKLNLLQFFVLNLLLLNNFYIFHKFLYQIVQIYNYENLKLYCLYKLMNYLLIKCKKKF